MKFSTICTVGLVSIWGLSGCSSGGSSHHQAVIAEVKQEQKDEMIVLPSNGGGLPLNSPTVAIKHTENEKNNNNEASGSKNESNLKKKNVVMPISGDHHTNDANNAKNANNELRPEPPLSNNSDKESETQAPDNAQIFANLPKEQAASEWIALQFEDNQVKIVPIASHITLNNQFPTADILTDRDGRLLGYIGYAMLSKEKVSANHPDEKEVEYANFPLLKMDESQKGLPSQDMHYNGSLHYHYLQAPMEALQGRVSAHYHHQQKQIAIDLFGEKGEYWVVKNGLKDQNVAVEPNGEIFAKVWQERKPLGSFDGAIYGKNGEVLVGKVEYSDLTSPQDSWIGVVGATAGEQ